MIYGKHNLSLIDGKHKLSLIDGKSNLILIDGKHSQSLIDGQHNLTLIDGKHNLNELMIKRPSYTSFTNTKRNGSIISFIDIKTELKLRLSSIKCSNFFRTDNIIYERSTSG